jgi:hypothetical protein
MFHEQVHRFDASCTQLDQPCDFTFGRMFKQEPGRVLLGRITECFIDKFTTLKHLVPKLIKVAKEKLESDGNIAASSLLGKSKAAPPTAAGEHTAALNLKRVYSLNIPKLYNGNT